MLAPGAKPTCLEEGAVEGAGGAGSLCEGASEALGVAGGVLGRPSLNSYRKWPRCLPSGAAGVPGRHCSHGSPVDQWRVQAAQSGLVAVWSEGAVCACVCACMSVCAEGGAGVAAGPGTVLGGARVFTCGKAWCD